MTITTKEMLDANIRHAVGTNCHLMLVGPEVTKRRLTNWLRGFHFGIPMPFHDYNIRYMHNAEWVVDTYRENWMRTLGNAPLIIVLTNHEYSLLSDARHFEPMRARFFLQYVNAE